jgi:glutathione synthase/RimK-type ligase-like ATP-grasp enzyme
MKTIAFLVTHGYYPSRPDRVEPDYAAEQLALLSPALAQFDLRLEPVFWQDERTQWGQYAAVLPLMAWNYPQHVDVFMARLAEIDKAGVILINDGDTLRGNMDKSYLARLSHLGAPVPKTLSVEHCSGDVILASFDELASEEIIIKPRIGAGAWRQARLKRGDVVPSSDLLPPAGALIQPFLSSVTQEGEMSLLYFGGLFSHALMKRPKAGDYRTQGQYGALETGITPPDEALTAAQAVLALAPAQPLTYARVDLVKGPSDDWLLMELELIEPWLYLAYDGHGGKLGAKLFAQALNSALMRTTGAQ